ncbi:MAG: hypothetical protein SPK16_09950, partial [Corynebacterium sp.]|nr:hypothetical protein [Corynebacterium sp.]
GQKLRREGKLRRRAHELVRRKLDPRERFTTEDKAELVSIAEASNVPEEELTESIAEEVGDKLSSDSDIDYDPENPSGTVAYHSFSDPVRSKSHKPNTPTT